MSGYNIIEVIFLKNEKGTKSIKKSYEEISSNAVIGNPENVYEQLNRYGTYEIQPTADTENQYPCIAQGYNKKIRRRDGENSHHGSKWETEHPHNNIN